LWTTMWTSRWTTSISGDNAGHSVDGLESSKESQNCSGITLVRPVRAQ
jgi:hypothetical protein